MRKIKKIFYLLNKNPVILLRMIIACCVKSRFQPKSDKVLGTINGTRFEYDFNYGSQMIKMYLGVYEPLTVTVVQRLLRKGDTFIDVGANAGFISAVAANAVGEKGHVHGFEPSPRDYDRLKNLATLNPCFDITCNFLALGEKEDTVNMDVSNIFGWNTIVPGFMKKDVCASTIPVRMTRLDEYIRSKQPEIGRIGMIKIDVEGYEFFVLKGLSGYFEEDSGNRPPILCEIVPEANQLMAIRLADIGRYMRQFGYHAYEIFDWDTRIDLDGLKETTDVLFMASR